MPPPPLVPEPPSDPQTYRSSEWMQGPQLRQRTFFVRHVVTKRSQSPKFREKKHLFGGDHTFLGNLYQVYKMIIDQVLLMMGYGRSMFF